MAAAMFAATGGHGGPVRRTMSEGFLKTHFSMDDDFDETDVPLAVAAGYVESIEPRRLRSKASEAYEDDDDLPFGSTAPNAYEDFVPKGERSSKSAQTSLSESTRAPSSPWLRSMSSTGTSWRAPRKAPPLNSCPKWTQRFVPGLNPGHYNDTRPQGARQYFSKAQTKEELRRFYKQHYRFEKHAADMDKPPEAKPGAALLPKSLSSEGGTPLSLPGRHGPAGSMTHHETGEVWGWEDNWVPALRFRNRSMAGRPNTYYRPLADMSLFSEPERSPNPCKTKLSIDVITRHQARLRQNWPVDPRIVDVNDVSGPMRTTALEPVPW
eukprot:TRINITY_DN31015_c0_g1_i1.p1 TRINITY_DN31015_c0_g1~~TRINITY_DN31015_c0_g1_i1.p1  ORF type:complete len:352 (+),score=47.33 TRINITY_DN31015_c0_g1_i1:86-1057(+)